MHGGAATYDAGILRVMAGSISAPLELSSQLDTTEGKPIMAASKNIKPGAKSEAKRAETAVAVEQQADTIAEAFAVKVADAYDETSQRYNRAKVIAEAVRKGASVRTLAVEVTRIRIQQAYPHLDALAVSEYMAAIDAGAKGTVEQKMLVKRLRSQKLPISKSGIDQYNAAWKHVQECGLPTTAANKDLVALAYSLKSTSSTGELSKSIVASIPKVEESKRRETWIDVVTRGLEQLSSVKKSEGREGGTVETDAASVDPVESHTGAGAGEVERDASLVVEYLRGVAEYHWTGGDREAILAAMEAAMSALVGETLDVESLVEA